MSQSIPDHGLWRKLQNSSSQEEFIPNASIHPNERHLPSFEALGLRRQVCARIAAAGLGFRSEFSDEETIRQLSSYLVDLRGKLGDDFLGDCTGTGK